MQSFTVLAQISHSIRLSFEMRSRPKTLWERNEELVKEVIRLQEANKNLRSSLRAEKCQKLLTSPPLVISKPPVLRNMKNKCTQTAVVERDMTTNSTSARRKQSVTPIVVEMGARDLGPTIDTSTPKSKGSEQPRENVSPTDISPSGWVDISPTALHTPTLVAEPFVVHNVNDDKKSFQEEKETPSRTPFQVKDMNIMCASAVVLSPPQQCKDPSFTPPHHKHRRSHAKDHTEVATPIPIPVPTALSDETDIIVPDPPLHRRTSLRKSLTNLNYKEPSLTAKVRKGHQFFKERPGASSDTTSVQMSEAQYFPPVVSNTQRSHTSSDSSHSPHSQEPPTQFGSTPTAQAQPILTLQHPSLQLPKAFQKLHM